MLAQQQQIQLSSYSGLYDLIIPKDNLLRKINELIDFTFIHEELVNKYCLNNGRAAESAATASVFACGPLIGSPFYIQAH
jgi:hypothetical protein